jgi:hypothetical protein
MPTIKDLGKRVKAKYPGKYDDLSDEELGRRVKEKYPDQYQDFTDAVTRYEPVRRETDIGRLVDYYNPSRGRLSSWWQRRKSESRTQLVQALTQEEAAVLQQGAQLEEAVRKGRKSEADFRVYIAQHAATLFELQTREELIGKALEKGRDFAVDQQLIVEEAQSRIRMDELERTTKIHVGEHERRTQIDIESRWQQIVQDLDAADLLSISDQQLLKKLRQNLIELIRERDQIAKGDDSPSVKKRILARMDKDIDSLERLIDARQARLLSSENGEETRRLKEGTPDSGAGS